jgi:hypothetical protein
MSLAWIGTNHRLYHTVLALSPTHKAFFDVPTMWILRFSFARVFSQQVSGGHLFNCQNPVLRCGIGGDVQTRVLEIEISICDVIEINVTFRKLDTHAE